MPRNHPHANYQAPLLWVFKSRYGELGKRGSGFTKDDIDDQTDYFLLVDKPKEIQCTVTKVRFSLPGVNLSSIEDAYILNGHSYEDAEVVSETLGIQVKIHRAYDVKPGAAITDEAFNFPDLGADKEFDSAFGCGADALGSGVSGSSGSVVADKVVANLRKRKAAEGAGK